MLDLNGFWVLKPVAILAMLGATVALPRLPVAAPEREPPAIPLLTEARTLSDLHRWRDRLRADLGQSPTMIVTRSGVSPAPAAALGQLWAIDRRLGQEERARWLLRQANQAAAAAIALGDPATLSPGTLAVSYTHWDHALSALGQIPAETFGADQVAAQRQQYARHRAIAAYQYDTARSSFLAPIVEQTGRAAQVRLTVCNLQRECRRWQGSRPPASPASLIKVPIAIALVSKLHAAGIAPDTPLWISPSNWTEDAGSIAVRREYPLEQIMADMVSASSNIATNQLIDYLGWQGVNQELHNRGYTATRVSRKLVGEDTYPVNLGDAPNRITTDELTDMMVGIYNRDYPSAALIEAALANQRDRALGYAAVPPPIVWLGEKTGRNSQVMGTTTAVSVHGQCYIITATLDHGNEAALRSIMARVMEHLLIHNGFEPTDVPAPVVAVRPQAFLP
jgi:beta-lactamase class A